MNFTQTVPQNPPRVSVVLGVYNVEGTLADTLDSLLEQTIREFEIVVVDDGSSDGTPELLGRYKNLDSRIVVCRQENAGLTNALIRGCQTAKGECIARIDAGDLAEPSRLQKQLQYLDDNKDVVALGTGISRIGPQGEFLGETVEQIQPKECTERFLQKGVGLCHPSSMFRTNAYCECGGYRKQFRYAQDTDLWFRLSRCGLLAELPEPLLRLRIDTGGISPTNHHRQRILASLAKQSYQLRSQDQDDNEILKRAEQVSWEELSCQEAPSESQIRSQAEFFIGSQLFVLRDKRSRRYLINAIKHRPLWIRPWSKLLLSFLQK